MFIFECFICKVENVTFIGHGFVGVNLFLNFSLSNVGININTTRPILSMCSTKLLVMFIDTNFDHEHDSITLNKVYITGYGDACYNEPAMKIHLLQTFCTVTVEVLDSYFYDMDRMALTIAVEKAKNTLLISNCTFTYVGQGHLYQVIYGETTTNHITLRFEKCKFYNNIAAVILEIKFIYYDMWCEHQTNISFESCNFINNKGSLVMVSSQGYECKRKILFGKNINFVNNKAGFIVFISNMAVHMAGTMVASHNTAKNFIVG